MNRNAVQVHTVNLDSYRREETHGKVNQIVNPKNHLGDVIEAHSRPMIK